MPAETMKPTAVPETAAAKPVTIPPVSAVALQQAVTKAQEQAAKSEKFVTGVDIAQAVHDQVVPPQPPAGQLYRVVKVAELTDTQKVELLKDPSKSIIRPENNARIVKSGDGTLEDAIRAYNEGSQSPLSAKQLRIELFYEPDPKSSK